MQKHFINILHNQQKRISKRNDIYNKQLPPICTKIAPQTQRKYDLLFIYNRDESSQDKLCKNVDIFNFTMNQSGELKMTSDDISFGGQEDLVEDLNMFL